MKNKNRGFSLVELIIVVAILGALVAILAPQYFQYVEKSRAAVCASNIDTLTREAFIAKALKSDVDMDTFLQQAIDAHASEDTCPSGGTYSITGSKAEGWYLTCSKHGIGKTMKDEADAVCDIFKTGAGGRMDSSAIGFNNSSSGKVVAALEKEGLSLSQLGAVSWYFNNQGDASRFYWTTVDVTKMNSGDTTYAMCYNPTSKNYTVFAAVVKTTTQKVAGVEYTYNILETTSSALNSKATDQTYDTTLKEFNKYMNTGK